MMEMNEAITTLAWHKAGKNSFSFAVRGITFVIVLIGLRTMKTDGLIL